MKKLGIALAFALSVAAGFITTPSRSVASPPCQECTETTDPCGAWVCDLYGCRCVPVTTRTCVPIVCPPGG